MTVARKQLVCFESTLYYHCISRCVRRAFLCGFDNYINKSYEHRREWVESLILTLSQAFCIDVAAYTVMSNHYHVVLHINPTRLDSLSHYEVIDRWGQLYSLPPLVRQYRIGKVLESDELTIVSGHLERYRFNLTNISKFMGYLNERLARRANAEDGCTGRFWEGRFKSQALLDDQALIQCMAYVDLNPIRAGIAASPETSDYTSVKRRIEGIAKEGSTRGKESVSEGLLPFMNNQPNLLNPSGNYSISASLSVETMEPHTLPLRLQEYLDIVDWTGRQLRDDKRGAVSSGMPPILERFGFQGNQWTKGFQPPTSSVAWMPKALGTKESIRAYCRMIGKEWIWGISHSRPT